MVRYKFCVFWVQVISILWSSYLVVNLFAKLCKHHYSVSTLSVQQGNLATATLAVSAEAPAFPTTSTFADQNTEALFTKLLTDLFRCLWSSSDLISLNRISHKASKLKSKCIRSIVGRTPNERFTCQTVSSEMQCAKLECSQGCGCGTRNVCDLCIVVRVVVFIFEVPRIWFLWTWQLSATFR